MGHHWQISHETKEDMLIFKSFLEEQAEERLQSVPFLSKLKIFNDEIQLFADSAGREDLSMGWVYKNELRQGLWRETNLFQNGFRPNIALLELFTIVAAGEVWAPELAGKFMVLRSDNATTIAFINRMRGDIPAVMDLLCTVTKTCLSFQIYIKLSTLWGSPIWIAI